MQTLIAHMGFSDTAGRARPFLCWTPLFVRRARRLHEVSSCVSTSQDYGRHAGSLVVSACRERARRGHFTADESDMPHPMGYDISRKQRRTVANDLRERWVRRHHTAGRGRGIIPVPCPCSLRVILGTRATLNAEENAALSRVRRGREGPPCGGHPNH